MKILILEYYIAGTRCAVILLKFIGKVYDVQYTSTIV